MNENNLFLLLVIILLVLVSFFYPNPAAFYLILLTCSALLFSNVKKHKKFLVLLFLGSLLFKLVVFFTLNFYLLDNENLMFSDSASHWKSYQGLRDKIRSLELKNQDWETNHVIYSTILLLFGKSLSVLEVFNMYLSSLTAVVIFFISLNFFDKKIAKVSSLLVAFYPSLSMISTQLLKDPIMHLLTALIFLIISSNITFLRKTIFTALLLTLLGSSRSYVAALIFLGIILMGIINFKTITKKNPFKKTSVAVLILSIIILGGLMYPEFFSKIGVFENTKRIYQKIWDDHGLNEIRNAEIKNANTAFVSIDFYSNKDILKKLPLTLKDFFLRPYFWEGRDIFIYLLSLEMFLLYFLLPFVAYGVGYAIRNHFEKVLLIFFFISTMTLVYSLLAGNLGNLMRWRLQVYIYLLMFASVGLVHFYKKIKRTK